MSVIQESRGTFGAGHLIPSILALFWFKISFIAVLILGMIHSSWLHLGRPDMKHYPLKPMWQLVTSPARYELFISPGQASARLVCFKVDLTFKSTRDQQSLFTFGPVHTCPDIFGSAPFSFWIRLPSTRNDTVNPAYESAAFRIRFPEWTFLNTLWIRNQVDANSGYFLFIDITRSSPVSYREYSRWCRAECFRFFTS